ncbi:MAG: CRISPR-associated helicase Cas3' [Clostridium sp.]|uniref:CRISPR-associated helicase Cas3' n=1 Tax=Clostridium sp. TaxID=1506 RepID=UPI003F3933F4
MNKFLAKTYKEETIIEHTRKLLENLYLLKKIYPLVNVNWKLLYLACLYHDLGKMNTKFQNKIMKKLNEDGNQYEPLEDILENIEEIPHGYISPAFLPIEELEKEFQAEEIRVLIEAISYHHNREKLNMIRMRELATIIDEDIEKYYRNLDFFEVKINEKLNSDYIYGLSNRILRDDAVCENIKRTYVIFKGLLNKIDFAASSETNIEEEPEDMVRLVKNSLKEYDLNKLQNYMLQNSDKSLVIIASTGIGKTEGALVWIGKEKGFFTLPLKVSINSIYDRIISKEKIGANKKKVALLHSDTTSEYMKRDVKNEIDEPYLNSTKQLCMPITVCTVDQLINFIFKYEGFELKQATLSYSKIIIDEIQTYAPRLLGYLIWALKEVTMVGGKFAIVTATFPPIFENLMSEVGLNLNTDYIKAKKPFLKEINGKIMLRHKIKVYESLIEKNINVILKDNRKKKLIIVNTVKKAQEIYNELKDKAKNVHMFHARFTKEDRGKKEKEIFENGQIENIFEGIWITTQVVEASLDIDFDVLYTELSDLSGLLQRMGRAYRNRELDTEEANINVFVGMENMLPSGVSKKKGIIDYTIFDVSRKCILKYKNKKLDEEEKMNMVKDTYSVENLRDSEYFNEIVRAIRDAKNILPYELGKNDERLREIESVNIIPEEIYNNEKEAFDEIIKMITQKISKTKKIKLKEKIMQKTIAIPLQNLEMIRRKGGVIREEELNNYEKIYIIPCKYSFNMGLECKKEYGGFSENQII